MTATVAAHRAQERWFLGRGLPSVLTQRVPLRAIWPCSAPFLAFTATSISANRRCESARLASTLEVAHSTKTTPRRLQGVDRRADAHRGQVWHQWVGVGFAALGNGQAVPFADNAPTPPIHQIRAPIIGDRLADQPLVRVRPAQPPPPYARRARRGQHARPTQAAQRANRNMPILVSVTTLTSSSPTQSSSAAVLLLPLEDITISARAVGAETFW
jgi:hypothetical protein